MCGIDEKKIFLEQARTAMTCFTTNVSNCTDPDAYKGGEKVKDRLRVYKSIMEKKYGSIGTTQTLGQSAYCNYASASVKLEYFNDAYGFKKTLSQKKAFSIDEINQYYKIYGYNYFFPNTNNEDENEYNSAKSKLEHLWYVELEVGSSDIKTGTSYSYPQKLNFDKEKIRMFLANEFETKEQLEQWAKNSNQNQTVLVEWASILKTGEHTNFYKEHEVSIKNAINNSNNKFTAVNTNDVAQSINTVLQQWQNDRDKSAKKIQDYVYDIMAGKAASMTAMSEEEVNKKAEEALSSQGILYKIPIRVSDTGTEGNLDNVIEGADNFLTVGKDGQISREGLQDFSSSLYNILLTAGIIVAVIIGLIIGIKFMIGSVEAKAEIKQLLVPYIVGCVVVFGSFGIWKIVVVILGQI